MIQKRIKVYGIVQGVGFRPTVSRHAKTTGVAGSVCNRGPYVEIYAKGEEDQVNKFIKLIKEEPPKRSAILKVDVKDAADFDANTFEIIESEKTKGEIFVSPDIAICDECLEELYDPNDKRYLHPFINCTSCGPRLTILDQLPYDRARTSMKVFPMCKSCSDEYYSIKTRRYDAQPVCCNDCGPKYYLLGKDGTQITFDQIGIGEETVEDQRGLWAIRYATRKINEGALIAVKGIGGFHLCCDGTNDTAIGRLRELKNRPMKPFAVMMKDMDTVKRECYVSKVEEEILTGHQKPILLLKKKQSKDSKLGKLISPDNPTVGVMLPYAPAHALLFDSKEANAGSDIYVMTSGNVSGAPICHNDEEAVSQISSFVDMILSHNRDIRIRTDDSVMDMLDDSPYMIRRSRGYAPLPYMVSKDYKGEVLAIGGELKNTFCIGKNNIFYPSSYVGDMADLRTGQALKDSVYRMMELLESKPSLVICDKHPKYNSSEMAKEIAKELGVEVMEIQHHYSHILSCMAENDYSGKVIGVSFDGTGYGDDETIWGGEILLCDEKSYTREEHIRPFFQMGGDASSKEGYRIAISMICGLYSDRVGVNVGAEPKTPEEVIESLGLCAPGEIKLFKTMYEKKINGITSTSVGRLFDAVSAILGIRLKSTFEGEASIALEHHALAFRELAGASKLHISGQMELTISDTDLLVKEIIEAKLAGGDTDKLAFVFHSKLAQMVVNSVKRIAQESGVKTVALSGGVFQNKMLTRMVKSRLEIEGFKVLIHHLLPANDGGIGLGQAIHAMEEINKDNK